MQKNSLIRILSMSLLVALGVAGGYLLRSPAAPPKATPEAPLATLAPRPAAPAPEATNALDDFAAIAALSAPAVVNISTRGEAQADPRAPEAPDNGPDDQDPFLPFFGPQEAPEAPSPREGMGSGFIVRADGVVLTNAHVIAGASEVTVKLQDRREFKARVVGVDKLSDTAVLKIEGDALPVVPVGHPESTKVGEWVLAIGSPFGFENTVTAGIVSAKSRSLPEEGYVPFIQTDVAVNPGNSGGPLINVRGEVIGINSQIYSSSGGYQGLSFAIPIDVALEVGRQLLETGHVTRGRIGVSVQDLSQGLAESFGLTKPDGALVGMVPPDGPGAKAGIRPGDVILALNGEAVTDSRTLPPKVAALKPGSEARLTLWREGQSIEVKVTVATLEDAPPAGAAPSDPGAKATGRLGLALRALSPEEQRQRSTQAKLLIESAQGQALKAGVRAGDLLLAINGEPVLTVDAVKRLSETKATHLALLIERQGQTLFIPVPVEKTPGR